MCYTRYWQQEAWTFSSAGQWSSHLPRNIRLTCTAETLMLFQIITSSCFYIILTQKKLVAGDLSITHFIAGENPFDLPAACSCCHRFKPPVLAWKDESEMSDETNPRHFFPLLFAEFDRLLKPGFWEAISDTSLSIIQLCIGCSSLHLSKCHGCFHVGNILLFQTQERGKIRHPSIFSLSRCWAN